MKNNLRSSVFTLIFLSGCVTSGTNPSGLPEIGSELDKDMISSQKILDCVTTDAIKTDPCFYLTVDENLFTVAYDEDYRVIYLYTESKNFVTQEGLKTGSTVKLTKQEMERYPGWAYYGLKTKDGWLPVLGGAGVNVLLDGKFILTSLDKLDDGQVYEVKVQGFAKSSEY